MSTSQENLRAGYAASAGSVLKSFRRANTAADQILSDSTLLRLTTVLQSTLDVGEIVSLFSRELAEFVPHDGLEFYRADEVAPAAGNTRLHECRYNLNLLGKELGEVVIARKTPSRANEIDTIEAVICSLVYPMRNALLYAAAIRTAMKDPVTGVNNRVAMDSYLAQKLSEFHRHGTALSLIMFDVDWFKGINDEFGHLAGDRVLATVAGNMIQCTRSSDSVFRYGGEEFVVILSSTDAAGAQLLAERIRTRIGAEDIELGESNCRVTVSGGVSTAREGDTVDSLLARADAMLYEAKRGGRDRVCVSGCASVVDGDA